MDKSEFLVQLRQSLSGEVASDVIEQNIKYYDGYISSQSREEEDRVLSVLGDPRLIAKTIIEAERVAAEKGKTGWSQNSYHSNLSEEEDVQRESTANFGKNIFFTNLKWYHKLIAVLVVIALFVIIALVGRLIIGFLFAFGLPIILILLVMALFRKR
ncbi:MAG: putative rane protein [Herbinix sp.]|jgi:uncharacterized membrane protein|nr:putative rane protein [Herbinix sp.]